MAHVRAAECRNPTPARSRWTGALTAALLGATGLVLALTAAVLAEPSPATHPGFATDTLVRRYYAAVNAALATGDLATLNEVVAAAALLPSEPGGLASSPAVLTARLAALHMAEPSLRVVVERVVADHDEAVAWVSLAGAAGGPVAASWAGPGQGLVDGFRVRDGRIAEVWGATLGLSAPEPVLRVDVDLMKGPVLVGLVRIEVAPGAETPQLTGPGPAAITVESGSVQSLRDGQVTRGLTREAAEMERAAPRVLARLGPGDQLALPSATPFRLRNEGEETAVALLVVVFPLGIVAAPPPAFDNAGLDVRSLLVETVRAPGETPSRLWPPGVVVQSLVGQPLADPPSGPWRLVVERLTLAPGIEAHWRPAGQTFLAGDLGAVLVTIGEAARDEETRPAILTGDSAALAIAPGTHVSVRGSGNNAAALILLSMQDAPATP